MPSLVLGTAQWGSGYGVTNTLGRPSDNDITTQLEIAARAGVVRLDTAAGYGDAQKRIQLLAPEFEVTTKVVGADPDQVADQVRDSLGALGRSSVHAVLLHDWDALGSPEQRRAAAELEAIRDSGLVRHVGASVYDGAGLESARDAFSRLDIVQVPANALDRRLDGSHAIESARAAGARVQVRSAFLQGLLAAAGEHHLARYPAVQAWFDYCTREGLNPIAAALAHVRALSWCDDVVIGVTSADELRQVLAAWESRDPQLAPETCGTQDLSLIDPRLWKELP